MCGFCLGLNEDAALARVVIAVNPLPDAAAFYAANTDEIVEPLPFDGAEEDTADAVRWMRDREQAAMLTMLDKFNADPLPFDGAADYRAEVRRIRAAHLDALEPRVRAAVAGLLWLNDLQRRDVLAVVIDAMRSAER